MEGHRTDEFPRIVLHEPFARKSHGQMIGVKILFVIFLLLIAAGVGEAYLHRRNLSKIPIRIHVNGTRGKSSVVRLIAGGLREGGVHDLRENDGDAGPDDPARCLGIPDIQARRRQRHRAGANRVGIGQLRCEGHRRRMHGPPAPTAVDLRILVPESHPRRDHERPRRPSGRDGPGREATLRWPSPGQRPSEPNSSRRRRSICRSSRMQPGIGRPGCFR